MSTTPIKADSIQPAFLRPPESAAYIGISLRHLNNLARRGILRPARIGKRLTLYARADLERTILALRQPGMSP